MTTREIKTLLEKYYNGEATDEEENFLRKLFRTGDVPAELKDEEEIFRYYSDASLVPEPSAGFEKRIIAAVDKSNGSRVSLLTTRGLYTILSIAAGLLILLGSYFFIERQRIGTDTFTDPQLAYAETMKILYEVSSKLNKGTQPLDQIKRFQEAGAVGFNALGKSTEAIDRSIQNLDYFQKMLNIASTPMDVLKKGGQ